jgi:putative glycosyltransferase
MYYSAPYIREFYERTVFAAQKITDDFEIIFVNDGSPDNSLDIAVGLHNNDSRVIVIDLSRNFGHHKAVMTGLSHARGEMVFLLDGDLEEEPELLNGFYEKYRQGNCDVVYGVQARRKGSWFERISGDFFYWTLNKLTNLDMPRNIVMARLMSRRYVRSLIEYKEREVFLAGLWHITGYVQMQVTVTKKCKGETTYNLRRKLSLLVNSITSFSDQPLRVIFYTGAAISFTSACYVFYLTLMKLFYGTTADGWTSLIVSLWFIGGLIMLSIGVIGIYLSKIFIEIKQRPYTTIRNVYGTKDNS